MTEAEAAALVKRAESAESEIKCAARELHEERLASEYLRARVNRQQEEIKKLREQLHRDVARRVEWHEEQLRDAFSVRADLYVSESRVEV